MKVTSESLLHFTKSLSSLESILTKKFKLTYCKEEFVLNGIEMTSYFPMVSFCDIPLSLADDQIEKYGSYAIGLSKEWGIKHNLNPVIYVEKNSVLSTDLMESFQEMSSVLDYLSKLLADNKIDKNDIKPLFESFRKGMFRSLNIHRYIKNYKGVLTRKNKIFPDYNFYDEREWRYVPAYEGKDEFSLSVEQFEAYRSKSKSKPLIDDITLDFRAADIQYLLVKSSKDIPKLIRLIKSTQNLTTTSDEADVLTTKILTVQQLNADF